MSRHSSQPPIGLSVEEHDRLDSWLVEIAAEGRSSTIEVTPHGYRIGTHGSLFIRKDTFFCDFEAGGSKAGAGGFGAIAFLRYKHTCDVFDAVRHGLAWLATHVGRGRLELGDDESEVDAREEAIRQATINTLWTESSVGSGTAQLTNFMTSERAITTIAAEDWNSIRWVEQGRGDEGAMLVAITDTAGNLVAVQQTFITPRGFKSPHEPARITLRGPRNWASRGVLRFGDQTARRISICEGTEDGLTVRMAGAEGVVVTLGVGNLGAAKMPATTKEVVVVRHPERPGAPGDKALWVGITKLLAQGLKVLLTPRAPTVFSPTAKNRMKDVNDVVKAHGITGVKALLEAAKPVAEWPEEVDAEAVIEAMSRLTSGGYEHARTALAKLLGWRVGALDKERARRIKERAKEAEANRETVDPNDKRRIALPHPEPQKLADILDDIRALVLRHIHIEEWVADLLSVFAAYTHVYQMFDFAVRIRFRSVDPESGKTTTMMLILRCCQANRRSDDITAANLSRAFDKPGGCTFGIDEDTSINGRDLVVSIIRAGYDREAQRDLMDKDDDGKLGEVSFNLFGPVMMTGLEKLEPMLQTRCVEIEMQPPLPPDIAGGERKKPKVRKRSRRLCEEYASRLARWAHDEHEHVQGIITEIEEAGENEVETEIIPPWVDNRTEDKLTPLFVVAYLAGEEWHRRMLVAARKLSPVKTREDLRPSVQLLLDVRDLITRDQRVGWTSEELRLALIAGEDNTSDTTWADMPARDGVSSGKSLSQPQLVSMLRSYGIKKRRARDPHADPEAPRAPRRYLREDFSPVFDRYLTRGRVGTQEELDGGGEPEVENPPEPPETRRRQTKPPPAEGERL